MICVIATLEVDPGRRDDLLAMFERLTPKVRAEKGCIEYAPMIDAAHGKTSVRPNVVTMVEKWESLAALEAHLITPHMVDFVGQTAPLGLKMDLQILQPS
jgi:quinol monooxygenase YgiN